MSSIGKTFIQLLVLILVLDAAIQSTTMQTADITYECWSDGTIKCVTSVSMQSYDTLILLMDTRRSYVNCTATKEQDGGFLIKGSACFNNLLRGYLTAVSNPNIIGGKNFTEFAIKCDELLENELHKTLTAKASLKIASDEASRLPKLPQIDSESSEMKLIVTDKMNNVQRKFDAGDIQIIHITRSDGAYMFLQDCTAFQGTSNNSKNTNYNFYKDFTPVDTDIVEFATDGHQGEITANVYTFQFVGSTEVTYQCNVFICPDSTCRLKNTVRQVNIGFSLQTPFFSVGASVGIGSSSNSSSNAISGGMVFPFVASITLLKTLF